MMHRRDFLLCLGSLPLAGCHSLEVQPNRAKPNSADWKRTRLFVVPSYGHSSLARAQLAVDFAKRYYPNHHLMSTSAPLTGRQYSEIVVHPDVWQSVDPRVVTWVYTSLRTRLKPGGRYIELGK